MKNTLNDRAQVRSIYSMSLMQNLSSGWFGVELIRRIIDWTKDVWMSPQTTLVWLLLITQSIYAQSRKQNQNWIFGKNARIEFKNPASSNLSSKFNSIEACAIVSNPNNGELLFYSDGTKVIDKNGDLMQNGDSLKGSQTASQGALILPFPGDSNQYILFTTPSAFAQEKGLYYNIIDMTLNNGLGGVVKGMKNILLYDNVVEGMTYAVNSDSTGYWLLTIERMSNTFLAFEVNKYGIGKNIKKSNVGRIRGKSAVDYGEYMVNIKISPNGKRISVSNFFVSTLSYGIVNLYDFNACEGTVLNEMTIKELPYNCYGAAFSGNSNVLYITSIEFPSRLFQIDLLAGSEAQINASKQIIYSAPMAPSSQNRIYYLSGLQLYEDGKIYVCESFQNFIHCIENPNQLGLNCGFVPKGKVLASSSNSAYTLPQLVPELVKDPKVIFDTISISINDSCLEKIKTAKCNNLINPKSIVWNLINLSNNDTIVFKDSLIISFPKLIRGTYKLEVFAKKDCQIFYSTIRFNVVECTCKGKLSISDTCINNNIELKLITDNSYKNINWLVTDVNGNIIYKQISRALRIKVDTAQKIKVRAIIEFDCKPDTLEEDYYLTLCPQCDNLFIPGAFTNNRDGLNDQFKVVTDCELDLFSIKIFNRWGEKIHQSTSIDNIWDGYYRNAPCQEGVYIYSMVYRIKGLSTVYKNGTVTILK